MTLAPPSAFHSCSGCSIQGTIALGVRRWFHGYRWGKATPRASGWVRAGSWVSLAAWVLLRLRGEFLGAGFPLLPFNKPLAFCARFLYRRGWNPLSSWQPLSGLF